MPTITFAHLDAMMRIVREPAPPVIPAEPREAVDEPEAVGAAGIEDLAGVSDEPGVSNEAEADARPDARRIDVRSARTARRAARLDARFERN